MAHVHRTDDDRLTSIEVIDTDDDSFHFHRLPGGERTTSEEFGPGHRHRFGGAETSEPIAVSEDSSTDEDEKDGLHVDDDFVRRVGMAMERLSNQ